MDAQALLSTVLASAIHEIKNNMGVLFARIENFTGGLDLSAHQQNELAQLKNISDAVNHELVRVLLLYKANIGGYSPHIEQYAVADLFDDAISRHTNTALSNQLQFANECDDDLLGFFDESLLNSLLDTAIFNSVKAGASSIRFSAREEKNMLVIAITDNGPGFPAALLNSEIAPRQQNGSSTGLGLYFAQTIAQLHENNGVRGFIRLKNQTTPAGGSLELWLP